ncbi:MAG: DUF493 domain-containing protein [Coxiellaceae bacterium]|nr:DUF493 domain-containing protein [Coxiellaceae bacterium]
MSDQDVQQHSSPIQFPCDFVLKVMGKQQDSFKQAVLSHVQKHYPDTKQSDLSERISKDGNYLALTVTVHAESQADLDKLYQDLSSDPEVLMAL